MTQQYEKHFFISHASEDKDEIARPLANELGKQGCNVWFDEFSLSVGDSLFQSINRGLITSRFGIVIISSSFMNKKWPQAELNGLIQLAKEGSGGKKILPIWYKVTQGDVENYSPILADIIAIQMNSNRSIKKIAQQLKQLIDNPTPSPPDPPPPKRTEVIDRRTEVIDRMKEEHWLKLERIILHAVTTGGIAAMNYYRQPSLLFEKQDVKNPTTVADLEATAAMLLAMDRMTALAKQLRCATLFLGEETQKLHQEWLKSRLPETIFENIAPSDEFFESQDNIRVIFDAIDGTGNFTRDFPLFCSSVAIIISDQVRVAAVYEPAHNIVYSAVLQGPKSSPESQSVARSWEVSTGNRTNLVEKLTNKNDQRLIKEAIGVHFTRSNNSKLHDFMLVLEELAKRSNSIYAINSGILSMTNVATGSLGAFVNNWTNLWDIAAGEVLIRACGGRVTTFDEQPIDYCADPRKADAHRTSVVAAYSGSIHDEILQILKHGK